MTARRVEGSLHLRPRDEETRSDAADGDATDKGTTEPKPNGRSDE